MKGIKLENQGYSPYQAAAKDEAPSIWNKEISFGPLLSLKDRQNLYHLMAILLESGLGILDCLQVIMEQSKKRKLRSLLTEIFEDLEAGESLSESLSHRKKHFNAFEVHTIRMGEQTGRMAYVLKSLAALYEKRIKLKRKVIQAFSYPIAVIVIAVLVLSFMIGKVVPMFEDIFNQFDAALPPITQAILDFSAFFRANLQWIALGTIAIITFFFQLRKNKQFRHFRTALMLKTPIFGRVMLKLQLSRLCYTFALLLKSKVKLDQALELLESIITFYPIQKRLPIIRQEVIEGGTLHDAIRKHDIFPPFLIQIIRVGEKTARLDEMLETLAQNLEEESEAGVSQLTQFLEPVLIIVLGLMVALILVAMYLPMFELSGAVG